MPITQEGSTGRTRGTEPVTAEVTTGHAAAQSAKWADENESDFQAFESAVKHLRATDTWRSLRGAKLDVGAARELL
jgi:hypothetical protein